MAKLDWESPAKEKSPFYIQQETLKKVRFQQLALFALQRGTRQRKQNQVEKGNFL